MIKIILLIKCWPFKFNYYKIFILFYLDMHFLFFTDEMALEMKVQIRTMYNFVLLKVK